MQDFPHHRQLHTPSKSSPFYTADLYLALLFTWWLLASPVFTLLTYKTWDLQ